ncbi:hypothetical protein DDE74_02435 [Streptomyces lydicus]|uniref:Uncharacterized protein n=1 Tax=Streptomyces lydicus TaxID=47763 RepID=A0A3S9Y4M0_9ACTN|nr:hypothetical protein DDE74_02435 [Streptomyces lydicus]
MCCRGGLLGGWADGRMGGWADGQVSVGGYEFGSELTVDGGHSAGAARDVDGSCHTGPTRSEPMRGSLAHRRVASAVVGRRRPRPPRRAGVLCHGGQFFAAGVQRLPALGVLSSVR